MLYDDGLDFYGYNKLTTGAVLQLEFLPFSDVSRKENHFFFAVGYTLLNKK